MGNSHSNEETRFPDNLRLANGTSLQHDPSRLLLFFKRSHALSDVARLITNLQPLRRIGLALEGQENIKQINHNDKRFWIKVQKSQRIDQQYTALIESELANDLERVAGVYSIPGITGIGALTCPM